MTLSSAPGVRRTQPHHTKQWDAPLICLLVTDEWQPPLSGSNHRLTFDFDALTLMQARPGQPLGIDSMLTVYHNCREILIVSLPAEISRLLGTRGPFQ
jgi:hypothetical protein